MNKTIGPGNFNTTTIVILYDEQTPVARLILLLLWHCKMNKTMGPGNFNTTTIMILYDEKNTVARLILLLLWHCKMNKTMGPGNFNSTSTTTTRRRLARERGDEVLKT